MSQSNFHFLFLKLWPSLPLLSYHRNEPTYFEDFLKVSPYVRPGKILLTFFQPAICQCHQTQPLALEKLVRSLHWSELSLASDNHCNLRSKPWGRRYCSPGPYLAPHMGICFLIVLPSVTEFKSMECDFTEAWIIGDISDCHIPSDYPRTSHLVNYCPGSQVVTIFQE